MNDPVTFRATWAIKPGKAEQAKKDLRAFLQAIEQQPGTRMVGVFLNPDQRTVTVQEVHQDTAAVKAHVTGKVVPVFGPRLMESMDFRTFDVFGKVPADVEGMLKGWNPTYHAPVGQFLR